MINGISVSALSEFAAAAKTEPTEARSRCEVKLDWLSGTRSRVETQTMTISGRQVSRPFSWTIDEPRQLLGLNHGPNPQELLMSGLGGCLLVSYVVGASVMGIQLDRLTVTVHGELDLRGFMGTQAEVPVGFRSLNYQVEISGNGSRQQFQHLHEQVMKRSPNRMTIAEPTPVIGELVILASSDDGE